KMQSDYADLPFGERYVKLLNEMGQKIYPHFDVSLPKKGITATTPIHLGPAIFNMLTSPRLLDVVESLLGPEIYSNPVQHIRIKPPQRIISAEGRGSLMDVTDWHQDQGVILPEADETRILTVWVDVTAATLQNGAPKCV